MKIQGKNKSLGLRDRGKTIRRELRRSETLNHNSYEKNSHSRVMGLYIVAVGHIFSLKGLWEESGASGRARL